MRRHDRDRPERRRNGGAQRAARLRDHGGEVGAAGAILVAVDLLQRQHVGVQAGEHPAEPLGVDHQPVGPAARPDVAGDEPHRLRRPDPWR